MQAVNSWIAKLEVAELRPTLSTFFDRYVETTIEHCRRNFKTVVPLPAISQALTVCRLLEAVLPTVSWFTPSMGRDCGVQSCWPACHLPRLLEVCT